jgi:hypothetical protein
MIASTAQRCSSVKTGGADPAIPCPATAAAIGASRSVTGDQAEPNELAHRGSGPGQLVLQRRDGELAAAREQLDHREPPRRARDLGASRVGRPDQRREPLALEPDPGRVALLAVLD